MAQSFCFRSSNSLPIPARLFGGRERMKRTEFRPGDWNHLGGGVELHGAGAERNHRAVERQIAISEFAHITQQFGLGPVAVKDRMLRKGKCAPNRSESCVGFAASVIVSQRCRRRRARLASTRRAWWSHRVRCRARLAASPCGHDAEIDLFGSAARDDLLLSRADRDRQRVEERIVEHAEAEAAQARPQAWRSCGALRGQCGSDLPGRDRPRTSTR